VLLNLILNSVNNDNPFNDKEDRSHIAVM